MNSIPIDLVMEISSRLPAKSIARFHCVSKLWGSMFHRSDFTELFLTRSSTRPRLLFAVQNASNGGWHFFSLPQPHYPYGKASLVVSSGFRLMCSQDMSWLHFCNYASGLICFSHHTWISEEEEDIVDVICNPSTSQRMSLPKLMTRESGNFLGFDPIDKQFKVLSNRNILTLEAENMRWSKIQCSLTHYPYSEPICINGVLYYLAKTKEDTSVIVCFDVRSEKYKFIESQEGPDAKLINYKGKLAGISWNYYAYGCRWRTIELNMWFLEDAETQEFSKRVYTLHNDNIFADRDDVNVAGVTATGEIVLSMRSIRKPFYVLFFNPDRNTLESVKLEGFGDMFTIKNNEVYTFVDHVEDLML